MVVRVLMLQGLADLWCWFKKEENIKAIGVLSVLLGLIGSGIAYVFPEHKTAAAPALASSVTISGDNSGTVVGNNNGTINNSGLAQKQAVAIEDKLAEIQKQLTEALTPKQAGEDLKQRQLPPELIEKAKLLLERGNQEQQAVAQIALGEYNKADAIIQQLKQEPLAESFRLLTLEGKNWYNAGAYSRALQPYEQALMLRPHDVQVINNLALTNTEIGMRTEDGQNFLQRAVTLLNENLANVPEHSPDWAMTQNNRGNALLQQGIHTTGAEATKLLVAAVASYDAALEVYTRTVLPQDWSMTQNNRGNALKEQGSRMVGEEGTKLLEAAVVAYDAALEVCTRTVLPQQWSGTQNNRGNALLEQGDRTAGEEGTKLLAAAVVAYDRALEVRTRTALPQDWAMTQNNLGNVLKEQGMRTEGAESAKLLEAAVKAYDCALEVNTRTALPLQWAATQNNRGNALTQQGIRTAGEEGVKLLAAAVASCDLALEIRTRTALPQDWAMTQNNRGSALKEQGTRTEGEEGIKWLEAAITAYKAALTVFTMEDSSYYNSYTKANLESAEAALAERLRARGYDNP